MVPQTKVFVGSLPQGSKPEELRRLFERFGVVTECDVMNRCGFVHMQTEDMATNAIRALNNTPFNGGVITVERGRIKQRAVRNGPPRSGPGAMGNGMGGGMRNGIGGAPRRPGGGGPMRGPPMGGRDPAPYMRDSRPPMRGGDMRGGPDMRGPIGGGSGSMGMRNGMGGGGGGFDRGMDRPSMGASGYGDDRYNGFSGEDRRGFALMDRGLGGGEPGYGGGMYPEERRGGGYGSGMDDRRAPMYSEERRPGPMYQDDRDLMMERRGSSGRPPMPMPPSFERGAPRGAPMGNGDMFSRRSPPMRSGGGGGGYGERDPYSQQFPPLGRVGSGAGPRGGRDMGMGPRRY